MRALSDGGAPVPAPIERTGDAILMTYIGDEETRRAAAARLPPRRPRRGRELLDQVLGAIERMLFLNVVHGDLSPYNLLVWDGTSS